MKNDIRDKEENYIRRLADYLEKKKMQPFVIRAFTDIGQLKRFVYGHCQQYWQ